MQKQWLWDSTRCRYNCISIIDTITDPGQQSYIYFSYKLMLKPPPPLFVLTLQGNKQTKNLRMLVQHAMTCDAYNSVTNHVHVV